MIGRALKLTFLAKQPYVKVERKLSYDGIQQIEEVRYLYLYYDRVVTAYREFPIEQVLDFSFRGIAAEGGLLYLHSSRGVFTYPVKTEPVEFIKIYKAHFKDSFL